uniref:Reverse transcriptase domain-containing protein n=1 Tax=Tanacetum cinerariifolium TaxID=118510 RepID=A0A6L2NHP5_TANCI|nr:reverse transcriptase domain-containing protein [Tanacetum cinerariifolium]
MRQNKRCTPNIVEPELCTIVEMADNRTMEELLQAPTEGYGEAIIIPKINADHFEIKTNLLQWDVPNDVIKLMMFSYSFEGNARVCNQPSVCVATGTYNQVSPQNCASNFMAPPGFAPNQSSTSGTLSSNTIPNPKGEMKAITTWSGVAYERPSIPTPKKVVEQETEETTDKEQSNFQGTMLLKKLPEKLGDPDKFLIPCDFLGMDLSLPELTPTRMTLELADRSITCPKGVTEDVFVKVGKFHFPPDFVVVDFEADPRLPLILERSFLRTGRALIDVYGEEITLRVNDETVTFNLDQNTRYCSTYDDLSVNRIDIIDVAREGNFILEEIVAYLKDESVSPKIDHANCDPEGGNCLVEKLLNDDPFQLPLMDLKQGEVVKEKSSIKEPPKLELKELPSHLEYAYLDGVDKLPVIIRNI